MPDNVHLARSDSALLEALVHVAQAEDEDDTVSRAAGESIALILVRSGDIDRVPLHDFSQGAYLAYDETISRYQHSHASHA